MTLTLTSDRVRAILVGGPGHGEFWTIKKGVNVIQYMVDEDYRQPVLYRGLNAGLYHPELDLMFVAPSVLKAGYSWVWQEDPMIPRDFQEQLLNERLAVSYLQYPPLTRVVRKEVGGPNDLFDPDQPEQVKFSWMTEQAGA